VAEVSVVVAEVDVDCVVVNLLAFSALFRDVFPQKPLLRETDGFLLMSCAALNAW
jgi:hypothetical protein